MRRFLYVLLLVALPLTGCIETVYRSGKFLVDATELQPWKKLALDGDVEAQYKVGELYCCGDRPDHDNVQALYWWCQAAKKGQRDAQYKVGWMMEDAHEYKGSIVPYNPVLASVYYTKALANGQPDAAKALAKMKPPLTDEQKKEAAELLEEWPNIACEVAR